MLSRHVAQVFSELFWDGSICHYYYWYSIIIIIIIIVIIIMYMDL
jgi:hypothetical protein